MKTTRAETPTTAIYCRISKDTQNRKGVDRQEEACRDLCRRQKWAILPNAFEDNDISASRYTRRKRPAFLHLMEEVKAGHVERIVCFKLDRLYRQPRQLEELIDLAEKGLRIVAVEGGEVDLNTSQGRTMARVAIAMAAGESDSTSERLKHQKAQRRQEGLPNGGPRAVGWKDLTHHHKAEAKVLVDAMDMLLQGRSLNDLARDWNRKAFRGRRNWTSADMVDILSLPRHAGLVGHKGAIIREATFKGIVDRAKWEQVCAVIAARRNGHGAPRRRSMLTGLVLCGKCGATMTRSTKGSGQRAVWRCHKGPGKPGCGNVAIMADKLEDRLVEATFQYVDHADLSNLMAEAAPDLSAITKEIATLDRREEQLASSMAKGKIKSRRLFELTAGQIEAERHALKVRLARESKRSTLVVYAGQPGTLRRAWDGFSVDQKRAIIRESLGSVTIMPRGRSGGEFDVTRIVIG